MTIFDMDLSPDQDFYTFLPLVGAPTYAIAGGKYLGASAITTVEGPPWHVMRANDLVYDFESKAVVPITSITLRAELKLTSTYLVSNGLIMPGSLLEDGSRVTDYSAWYLFGSGKFKYSELRSA